MGICPPNPQTQSRLGKGEGQTTGTNAQVDRRGLTLPRRLEWLRNKHGSRRTRCSNREQQGQLDLVPCPFPLPYCFALNIAYRINVGTVCNFTSCPTSPSCSHPKHAPYLHEFQNVRIMPKCRMGRHVCPICMKQRKQGHEPPYRIMPYGFPPRIARNTSW